MSVAKEADKRPGQHTIEYRNINVSGHARVHNGPDYSNVTHHHYAPAKDDTKEIRAALFVTDPEIDRCDLMRVKGNRVPGTCQWIVQSEKYQAWIQGRSHMLSVSGGPGKGKTMLADYIISQLEEICKARNDAFVTYFFCLNADPRRNNAVSILRGLLYHLIRIRPVLMEALRPFLGDKERRQAVLSSPDSLWSILVTLAARSDVNALYCVIDGLDECSQDTHLFLAEHCAKADAKLRIVVLSRPLPALRAFAQIKMNLEDNEQQIGDDINSFIEAKLMDLRRLHQLDDKFRHYLHEQLAPRADGTFLWIGFAAIELMRQTTRSAMKDCVMQLPAGLPALYARMLRRVADNYKGRCLTVLKWAALATRPLSIAELTAVFEPKLRGPVSTEQESEIRDIVEECGSILTIEDGMVALVHQSARDYLLQEEKAVHDPVEQYWRISAAAANTELLRACVSCIETSNFRDGDVWLDELESDSPFLRYATESLCDHARLVPESQSAVFGDAFFRNDTCVPRDNWAMRRKYGLRLTTGAKVRKQFIWACELNVYSWLKYLLSHENRTFRRQKAVKADMDGETLLVRASHEGYAEIVALLLEYGANANQSTGHPSSESALKCAVESGNLAIVRLLVEHGAQVAEVYSRWAKLSGAKCPLSVLNPAVISGRPSIVAYLLDHGAKANLDDCDDHNMAPLSYAIGDFDVEMVRCLLDSGASVRVRLPEWDFGASSDLIGSILELMDRSKTYLPQESGLQIVDLLLTHGVRLHSSWREGLPLSARFKRAAEHEGRLPFALHHARRLAAEACPEDKWIQDQIAYLLNGEDYIVRLLGKHSTSSEFPKAAVSARETSVQYLTRSLPALYRNLRYENVSDTSKDLDGDHPWLISCDTSCALCGYGILGVRHRCAQCDDVDFCGGCLRNATAEHPTPGHSFKTITSSGIEPKETEEWWPYFCDGCQQQIFGVRHTKSLPWKQGFRKWANPAQYFDSCGRQGRALNLERKFERCDIAKLQDPYWTWSEDLLDPPAV